MEDGVWRTINGVHVLIGKDGSILKGPKSLQKSDIQKRLKKQIKQKEEISLSRAKQRFKNNIDKYGAGGAFEDAILEYNLRVEEIESLYKYAEKMNNFKFYKAQIDGVYNNYTNKKGE